MIGRNALLALGFLQLCICIVAAQRAPSQAAVNFCRSQKGKNGAVFAHEEYCDYYYECDPATDEPVLQACANGLAFAGKGRGLTGACDYPHRVSCPDGTRTMGQQPQTSENCQWQYGVFPHATSCTRYWHCWNGTATIQQCPFSLLYNDAIHSCDWPDNVPDCQKHPICKDTPNGLVFIEKSCVRYWLCVGGYPRLQRCPAGLAVNPNTLKCELATNVPGCEPPPTQPPAAEEETSPAPGSGAPGSQQSGQGNNQGNNNDDQQGGQAQGSLARPLQFSSPSGPFRPQGGGGNPRG
uniref:Chondroitin proteoglycan-2 n=1 Tax=Aceria tosichella TaxID=561515 RepID=A0A6G1S9C0_9ACAR